MTEQEWLVCDNPKRMYDFLTVVPTEPSSTVPSPLCTVAGRRRPSLHKLEMFILACRKEHERLNPKGKGWNWQDLSQSLRQGDNSALGFWLAIDVCPSKASWNIPNIVVVSAEYRAHLLRETVVSPWIVVERYYGNGVSSRKHSAGPGCRILTIRNSWFTPTVLSLTNAAYDQRREDGTLCPDRLAVLSDTLEEVGCEEEGSLRHLRGEEVCTECMGTGWTEIDMRPKCGPEAGLDVLYILEPPTHTPFPCQTCNGSGWRPMAYPHVPGCWVLDLLLDKE